MDSGTRREYSNPVSTVEPKSERRFVPICQPPARGLLYLRVRDGCNFDWQHYTGSWKAFKNVVRVQQFSAVGFRYGLQKRRLLFF